MTSGGGNDLALRRRIRESAAQRRVNRGRMISVSFILGMAAPIFLYFWLCDGLWGCSVAKWLLRLRVTRAGSCAMK